MIQYRYHSLFIGLLLFHTMVLLYLVGEFSISFKEASIYFNGDNKLLYLITNLFTTIFGQNDFALRTPFILLYIGSSLFLYLLTDDFFKTPLQRVVNVGIFMMLPGVNSGALLVNESMVVVFLTLLYLLIFKYRQKHCYLLLGMFLFVDNSFAILFLSLFFYSLMKRDNTLLIMSLLLFGLSMSFFGFDVGGKPKSYFLDTLAIYGSIFSPILFLYFFYTIYRIGIKHEKELIWYISATALGFSLIFSLRQQIKIDDFAPFVVIAIPLMVKLFSQSLRVRLKEFRKTHIYTLRIALGVLLLTYISFAFNKYFYLFLKNPQDHFTYKYHIVKDLAKELKMLGIAHITTEDKELDLRLKFYGFQKSSTNYLSHYRLNSKAKEIEIVYHDKVVAKYYLLGQ